MRNRRVVPFVELSSARASRWRSWGLVPVVSARQPATSARRAVTTVFWHLRRSTLHRSHPASSSRDAGVSPIACSTCGGTGTDRIPDSFSRQPDTPVADSRWPTDDRDAAVVFVAHALVRTRTGSSSRGISSRPCIPNGRQIRRRSVQASKTRRWIISSRHAGGRAGGASADRSSSRLSRRTESR